MLAMKLYGWSGKLTLCHNIQPNICVIAGFPKFCSGGSERERVNEKLKTQENITNFSKKMMQYPKIMYYDKISTQKVKIKEIRNEDET